MFVDDGRCIARDAQSVTLEITSHHSLVTPPDHAAAGAGTGASAGAGAGDSAGAGTAAYRSSRNSGYFLITQLALDVLASPDSFGGYFVVGRADRTEAAVGPRRTSGWARSPLGTGRPAAHAAC